VYLVVDVKRNETVDVSQNLRCGYWPEYYIICFCSVLGHCWFGIATTGQYDIPTIIGLIFSVCIIISWIAFFIRGRKPMVKDKSRIDAWPVISIYQQIFSVNIPKISKIGISWNYSHLWIMEIHSFTRIYSNSMRV
jgi:hypothetical protein